MKKIFTLFYVFAFAFSVQLFAQSNSSLDHKLTYREIKQSGLIGNYTMDELMQLQKEDADAARANAPTEEELRASGPEPTHIESTSSSFTISPLNPSICTGNSVTLSVPTITSGVSNSTSDDIYSSTYNIGFSFTFYGISYTQLKIGSNGVVTFNIGNTFNSWAIGTCQPTATPPDMRNTVSGPWQDLYPPFGGTIKWGTVGTAPNRIFVAEWCTVPFFICTPGNTFTGQILLYETSNIIETHIFNKPCVGCMSWNGSNAIHSVQNAAGTVASVVPGRNCSNGCWTTTSEGKRWTWNGSTLNYDISNIAFDPIGYLSPSTITWNVSGNPTVIGTGNSLTVSPTTTTTYEANITCSWCGGTISYVASSTVTVTSNLPPATATSPTICPNTSTTLTGSCTLGCQWYDAATGGTQYAPCGTAPCVASGVLVTPPLSSTTTYWLTYTSGGCTPPTRTPITVTVGPTLAAPTGTTTSVCNSSTPATITADCGSNCEWYSTSTGGTPIGTGASLTVTPSSQSTYYVQTVNNGCTSPRTAVTINIGNLAVTASPTLVPCPTSATSITSTYSGAYSTTATSLPIASATITNVNTGSNTYCTTSDPSDAVNCPAAAYRTRTIATPAGVNTTITSTSLVSVHYKINNNNLPSDYNESGVVDGAGSLTGGQYPKAVGADYKVWLKSPFGTYMLINNTRPLNNDYNSALGNYCYCPTFTSTAATALPLNDGPYDGTYLTDQGSLASTFNGEPMAVGSLWTLYINDNVDVGGQSFNSNARIREFSMVFQTWPAVSYSWASAGSCPGSLSSTTTQNPTYNPPSPYDQSYSCVYTITVTSGTCTGTQNVIVSCSLPIDLLSFTGENSYRGNELTWVTGTETNNSYFTLYRSRDAKTFDKIWKIPSKAVNGNSTSNLNYSFVDAEVSPGIYYYRLTQTDIDGTTKEVGTIPLSVGSIQYTLDVIPNPTNDKADVVYTCQGNETASLKVYDHSGNLVMTKQVSCVEGENKYPIDLTGKSEGIYLITIATETNIFKGRLIKSH